MNNRFNALFRASMVGVITCTLLLACEKESLTSEEAAAMEAARLGVTIDTEVVPNPDSLCKKGPQSDSTRHPRYHGKQHLPDSLRSDTLRYRSRSQRSQRQRWLGIARSASYTL